MILVLIIFALLLLLLILESAISKRGARRIPIRIHVNGSRGKSTVTRYIQHELNRIGHKTMGKITGETPTLLRENNRSQEIKRFGPARVTEQWKTIQKAAKEKCDAVVLECMSIDPALQIIEGKVLQPHLVVLTNIKEDHREKLGDTHEERMEHYSKMIPEGTTLLIPREEFSPAFKNLIANKNITCIHPRTLDESQIQSLPKGVFPVNIELAAEAIHHITGKPRKEVIDSLVNSQTDRPTLYIQNDTRALPFLNGFTANDPESTDILLRDWTRSEKISGDYGIVFNTRADRPIRTRSLTDWILAQDSTCKLVIITGDHRYYARRRLRQKRSSFKLLSTSSSERAVRHLQTTNLDLKYIYGIGNLGSGGNHLLTLIKKTA